MIIYVEGSIFDSESQVLVNPVNTQGVMGKGLALEFKKRYPEMYKDYKKQCTLGLMKIGNLHLWKNDEIQVLSFPTKDHWKDKSTLYYIEVGLNCLAASYQSMEIKSIAIPPLGCGLGGLNWSDVKPLIHQYLENIEDLDVHVYTHK